MKSKRNQEMYQNQQIKINRQKLNPIRAKINRQPRIKLLILNSLMEMKRTPRTYKTNKKIFPIKIMKMNKIKSNKRNNNCNNT